MGLVGFIFSLLAILFMLIGLIPFLGWLNWITTLPLAVLAIVFGGVALSQRGRSSLGLAAVVIGAAAFLIGIFRLGIGCGIL